jgi:hypothetical protein
VKLGKISEPFGKLLAFLTKKRVNFVESARLHEIERHVMVEKSNMGRRRRGSVLGMFNSSWLKVKQGLRGLKRSGRRQ